MPNNDFVPESLDQANEIIAFNNDIQRFTKQFIDDNQGILIEDTISDDFAIWLNRRVTGCLKYKDKVRLQYLFGDT